MKVQILPTRISVVSNIDQNRPLQYYHYSPQLYDTNKISKGRTQLTRTIYSSNSRKIKLNTKC